MKDQRTPEIFRFWTSLQSDDELIGPPLLYPECTSVLRAKAWERSIRHDEALELADELLDLPVRIADDTGHCILAMQIANRTRRKKSYDMQYVAVAELEGCEMVTLDRGIYQASIERKIPARLLR
jgi:predicted nucleic acid-binding protein